MDDEQEARELIASIRAEKGVDVGDGGDVNAVDLARATKLLSEQLYSKPTRFLLELIQNADDNHYSSDVKPTMTIIYRKSGHLWIGCNELGFKPNNVRAICGVGGSTKTTKLSQKGYIGEKGIGFKSVFRVADLVWVSSGALQFHFDKTKRLGMIAPEWQPFRAHGTLKERTMFCFHVPEQSDRDAIYGDVMHLSAQMLLFLRNLMSISVRVEANSGRLESSFAIERVDTDAADLSISVLTRRQTHPRPSHEKTTYLIFEHTESNMPPEDKREDITESDVVLAIPITSRKTPILASCEVFNFLPIRTYGLPFLLQADFILTANREDVLEGNDWNKRLVSSAQQLFLDAVQEINCQDTLKWTWPACLESQGTSTGTIFAGFLDDLINLLRVNAVLYARISNLVSPDNLLSLPEVFSDGKSPARSLLRDRLTLGEFVSQEYSDSALQILRVRELSNTMFLTELREYVQTRPSMFQGEAHAWHCRVARAILHTGLASRLSDLPLIPLRSGEWVEGSAEGLYFPSMTGGQKLPAGIEAAIVEDVASSSRPRKQLFRELGVKSLDAEQVCSLIIQQHRTHGRNYGGWSRQHVVNHLRFLFNASQSDPNDYHDMRIATKRSSVLHNGRDLYINADSPILRTLTNASPPLVRVLDPLYFVGVPSGRSVEWENWIQDNLSVRTLPRLLSSSGKSLSREFEWLIDNKPYITWLQLIRDNWHIYGSECDSNARAKTILSKKELQLGDGNSEFLGELYLGTSSVLKEPWLVSVLPVLTIKDPEDNRWLPLESLGFSVRPTLDTYLTILHDLRHMRDEGFEAKDVKRIYAAISRRFDDDPVTVKEEFAEKDLIYISKAKPWRWIKLDECRWEAPSSLTNVVALKLEYPRLETLFVVHLGVKDADVKDIVAHLIDLSYNVEHAPDLKDLVQVLDKRIACDVSNLQLRRRNIQRLNKVAIFPVHRMTLDLRTPLDGDWFIVDRKRFGECFEGRIWVLDIEGAAKHLRSLIVHMKLESRFLSRHVVERTHTTGTSEHHPAMTNVLRSKAPFIDRLLPKAQLGELGGLIRQMEVWCSESLVLRRHIDVNGERIEGRGETGFVTINTNENRVYFSGASVSSNSIPYPQLAEKLAEVLDIETDELLLLSILTANDTAAIEDTLEKAGISDDDEADVLLEEDVSTADDNSDKGSDTTTSTQHTTNTRTASTSSRITAPDARSDVQAANKTISTPTSARSATRHSINRTSSSQTSRYSIIDVAQIEATANTVAIDDSTIIWTPSKRVARSRGHDQLLETDVTNVGASVRYGATRKLRSSVARASSDTFEMSSMRSVLSRSAKVLRATMISPVPVELSSIDSSSTTGATHTYQQEVGYGGELFVRRHCHVPSLRKDANAVQIYNLLKSKFGADDDCWTSNMRSRYGLERFTGREGAYSDFTIEDSNVTSRIVTWLETDGDPLPYTTRDAATFHLEVKGTLGRCEEPFMLSNNQLDLARKWHTSPLDIYIVLRVYNLASQPQFRAYVDPLALMEDGKLSFTAREGYYVQPI